jgi:hypothetical protein
VIETCLRVARACLPFGGAEAVAADYAAMAEVPPAPPPERSTVAAIAAIEASEFVHRDATREFERFGLLVLALEHAIARDRSTLAAIEAIEATPRPHGRSHGLEWAYEQVFRDTDRLRQCCELLRELAPHERMIRALVAGDRLDREA